MFMSMPVSSSRRAASPFSLPPLSSPNMTLPSPTLVFPTTVVSLSALFSILKQGLSDVSPSKETSLSSPTPLVLLSFFSIVEVIFFFFFFPFYNLFIMLCYVMLCYATSTFQFLSYLFPKYQIYSFCFTSLLHFTIPMPPTSSSLHQTLIFTIHIIYLFIFFFSRLIALFIIGLFFFFHL